MLFQEIGPIPSPSLTAEFVAGFVFILLMIGMEYIPVFRRWWDGYDYKRSFVALAGLAVVVLLLVMNYTHVLNLGLDVFTFEVVWEAFNVWLGYLGGSWLVWSILAKAGEQGASFGIPRVKERAELERWRTEAETSSPH